MNRLFLISLFFLVGCVTNQNSVGIYNQKTKIYTGSAISKNVFTDISQFANSVAKVRVRNTSGDQDINKNYIKSRLIKGLEESGFKINENNYDFIIDLNVYSFNSVKNGKKSPSSGVGVLLGGVIGSEFGKRNNTISTGSRIILGAIAGATLESILKEASETNTYVLLSDFNIGWLNKSKNEDSISIGGSTIKNDNNQNQSLKKIKDRGSLKILVYGGSNQKSKIDIIRSLENRLISISSNIL